MEEMHDSYGMIGARRCVSGGGQNLFGSPLRHDSTIHLTISRACKVRDLNRDRFYARDRLIDVQMSHAQFYEMITSLNIGDGVPCTLQHVAGVRMPPCSETNDYELFRGEFVEHLNTAAADAKQLVAIAEALLSKKNITKADRVQISQLMRKLLSAVTINAAFIQEQFNEAMQKTVSAAKSDVENFLLDRLNSIKAVDGGTCQLPKLLPFD